MRVTITTTVEGMPIVELKGIVGGAAIHGVDVGRDSTAMGRDPVVQKG